MVGSAKLKKSSIKVIERVDSTHKSNKRKKARSTTDGTGAAVPAKAQHVRQDSRVNPDSSPNDNTMPDRHARRDTNQSAFDKEYFDLIEETAIRIKQLDDTVDVTQFDRIIYDEIEWWKVPNWDDRLYYQAYEQWICDTPAAQDHAAQKAGKYDTTVFPRQLDADEDEEVDQDKPVDSESDGSDGEILTDGARMTVANRSYMSHEQEILMTIANMTVTGRFARDISKDEVRDAVHKRSQKWDRSSYDNDTFDLAWQNNIGDRETVGTAYVEDRAGETAGQLHFSPHTSTHTFERDSNNDSQDQPVSILKGSQQQQKQQQLVNKGKEQIDKAISEILNDRDKLMPDPNSPALEKLQTLLALRELTKEKPAATANPKSSDLNVKLPNHLHNYFDFSGDKDVLDFLNDLDDWFAMIPAAKHLPYFMLALAADIRKEWRVHMTESKVQLTYADAKKWLLDKCLERNSVDKMLDKLHSLQQTKSETMKQYTARATALRAELHRHKIKLDDAIMRKCFVDGAQKSIATKVRALSDYRELSLVDLYDRMDALWVASNETTHDFRMMEEEDSDEDARPSKKQKKKIKQDAPVTKKQITDIVNAAFQNAGKGKGKGRGAKGNGGRGSANKLPEFARMGMMKKFYSDKEWADRLAAYKRKELPSQHPKLYSKDRWEDKDSGKSSYCCFKCRKIGHTMDRCKEFQ